MIPDKIYIGTVTISSNEPGEQHLLPDWHKRPNPKIANVEYIRKGALIEWLKGMMTKEGAIEGFVGGYDSALKDVINHINSM